MDESGRNQSREDNFSEPSSAQGTESLGFNSENINNQQKKEHFTNISDAEQKEREKAKKREEKISQYLKIEKKKAADEKPLPKPLFRSKTSLVVTLIIVTVLILAGAFGVWYYFKNRKVQTEDEIYASKLIEEAVQLSGYSEAESDFGLGLTVFEKAEGLTGDENRLAYIYVAKAQYVGNYYNRTNMAREILNDPIVSNNDDLLSSCFYQKVDYGISVLEGNFDRVNEISEGGCLDEK